MITKKKTSLVCLFIMLIKLDDSIIQLEFLLNAFPDVIAKQNSKRSSHSSCSSLHKANSPDNPDFTKLKTMCFYLFSMKCIASTSKTPTPSGLHKTVRHPVQLYGKIFNTLCFFLAPHEGEGTVEEKRNRSRDRTQRQR